MRVRPSPVSPPEGSLAAALERLRRIVEERLDQLTTCPDAADTLARAQREAVLGGGKRMRPVFLLLVAEVLGRRGRPPVDVACAIEMVHAASLVLDDLPCMDDAATRRGRPALHRVWGEATAILAAFAVLARAGEVLRDGLAAAGVAPVHREALSGRLAQVVETLCRGQVLDLALAGGDADLERLEAIHAQKTGALFVLAAELGTACAGVWGREREALLAYARNLGLAFQVTDDLLDVIAAAESTGKPRGRDAALGRTTFVSVFGVQGAQTLCGDLIAAAREAIAPLGPAVALLHEFAEHVRTRTA